MHDAGKGRTGSWALRDNSNTGNDDCICQAVIWMTLSWGRQRLATPIEGPPGWAAERKCLRKNDGRARSLARPNYSDRRGVHMTAYQIDGSTPEREGVDVQRGVKQRSAYRRLACHGAKTTAYQCHES
ncbi:hypothetical protein VTN96DRAFT_3014 [Rasamsonia emersonii]